MKNNFNTDEFIKLNDFFENKNELDIFYPFNIHDFKTLRTLRLWATRLIFCYNGNNDEFLNFSFENELGLQRFKIIQVEKLDTKILKKLNQSFSQHKSNLPKKLGLLSDYKIKEIAKYKLIDKERVFNPEISFIKINAEAFSFYHFIHDFFQKKWILLLKKTGGEYNGEQSAKIVKACQEFMITPKIVMSTELNHLEDYLCYDQTIQSEEINEEIRIFIFNNDDIQFKVKSMMKGMSLMRRFGF